MTCLIKESAWVDVQRKAKRIRSSGGVLIRSARPSGVDAEVSGDNFNYVTMVRFAPKSSRRIAHFECGCGWGAYVWSRGDQYYGRLCSHALALQYEVQSRGMFGKDIPSDPDDASWPSNVKRPGDWDYSLRGYTSMTNNRLERHVGATDPWCSDSTCDCNCHKFGAPEETLTTESSCGCPCHNRSAGTPASTRHSAATSIPDCDGSCDCTCHEYDGFPYSSAAHHPCDCSCHDDVFPRTAAKSHKTARTNFSAVEQNSIISEGADGTRAGNLDRLDLTGTHYTFDEDLSGGDDAFAWWL